MFCEGKSRKENMYCKNCGKKINKGEIFCCQCGCSVQNEKNAEKIKCVWWKLVILAVIMLVGIGGTTIWWQKRNAENNLVSENKKTDGNNGKEQASEQYEYLAVVENKDNKMGYITKDGKEVAACKYDYAEDFEDGVAKVGIENGIDEEGETRYLYGLINSRGKEIVQCQYDEISILDDNGQHLIEVEMGGKAGLLDESGNWIVSYRSDSIWRLSSEADLFGVRQDGKMGCINSKGEEIIPCAYDYIYAAKNAENKIFIIVQTSFLVGDENTKWGIMNEKGQEVIPLQENYLSTKQDGGLIKIKQDGKYGFVNDSGERVIPVEYDFAGDFGKNRLSVVGKGGDTFIIDERGAIVSVCQNTYMYARAFENNGLACVRSERGYGWVNEYGKEVIPCMYDSVEYSEETFDSNGLAYVEKNGKYGFINEAGEEVIPCKYNSLSGFCCHSFFDNGLITAEQDGKIGCLNEEGDIVVPFVYDNIEGPDYEHRYHSTFGLHVMSFSPNMIVRVNGKSGILNENGEEIIPCIYERFDEADEKGFFVAYKGKSSQGEPEDPVLLNLSGEVVISEQYEYIGSFGDDDLAPVFDSEQCSYVDRNGIVVKVLPDKYKKAGKFVKIQSNGGI